ncbi:MAG TPA: PAS domain S-box protein [Terriglobales bacterium]|jgi:PAS domain S-box-containing protein|nr:PAS domain S-box protein [Terriglobales bacterium]
MSTSVSSAGSNKDFFTPAGDRPEHVVQFYQDDKFLIDAVSRFVGSALAAGDATVLIATAAHREGVEQVLKRRGLEIGQAARQGRFIAADATETLSQFMVDSLPDEDRFRKVVGDILAQAAASVPGERRIAAFGEMVNILWASGNYEAALRLEQLWNRIAKEKSFSLLCAYPIAGFNSAKHTEAFLKICSEHGAVFPSESFPATAAENDRLRSVSLLQQQAAAMQSETALLQSEQRFRLFVEAVRDYAIFMLDPSGRITTWNNGAERIKGYKPWEIIGQHFSVFYPEEDLKSRKPWHELEVAAEEGRFEDEGWRLRKDGTRFWANVIITAIKDESGRLLGFGKVTRDLTEKRRAHQELERAHQHLQKEVIERRIAEKKVHKSEESLRRLSQHLLRTQDEERKRIGRDLHDSLGQCLAILKINLDSIQLALPAAQAKAISQIDQCLQLTDEAIREVRTIAYVLYPPMLEELGLKSAISWYLEGFATRSKIKITFDAAPELERLERAVELALFRVLQESLANVHRHSGSRTAHIRLFQQNGSAVLEVEDEGKGFPDAMLDLDQDELASSFGVGLRGMSERLRELGGTVEFKPAKKQGAIVRAEIPQKQQQPSLDNLEVTPKNHESAA